MVGSRGYHPALNCIYVFVCWPHSFVPRVLSRRFYTLLASCRQRDNTVRGETEARPPPRQQQLASQRGSGPPAMAQRRNSGGPRSYTVHPLGHGL